MKKVTISNCRVCAKEIKQYADGSGAREVGVSKWFQTLEPWQTILIFCNECFEETFTSLLYNDEKKKLYNQRPR